MLKNFLTTAYRSLLKNWTSTFLNVVGLALGISICTLIGVWLQREVSFDNFHPQGDKLFRLVNTFKSESESFSQAVSGPAFGAQISRELPSVQSACRLFSVSYKMKIGDKELVEDDGLAVDSSFFSIFGFKLKEGQAANALNGANQIVLTEDAAKKFFGDQEAVGKTIQLDGKNSATVTAIVENPPINSQIQFRFLVPYVLLRQEAMQEWKLDPDSVWVGGWAFTFLKLKDPSNWKRVEKDINTIAAKFSEREWATNKMSYQYTLQPIRDIHLKSNLRYDAANNGSAATVKIFAIVGLIVLLLACINYINLTTAGALKRAKETALRKVIGASRIQLISQFFFETILVCLIAVLLGMALLQLILPSFSAWIGQPYTFSLSGLNLALLISLVLAVAMISGFYPALVISSFNQVSMLKGNFIAGLRGAAIRKGLVIFQFTISIALVASIIIINRQMKFIQSKSLGFNGNAVVEIKFFGDSVVLHNYAALRNELLKDPNILNVTKHGSGVVGGLGNGWTTTENLKGEEISTSLYAMSVDTNYFQTYDMKLLAGRFFNKEIPTDTTKAVLVNEAAVRTFGWQKPENAIGKRFGKGEETKYVIGVVKDFNFESLHKPVEALVIHYWNGGNRLSVKLNPQHIPEGVQYLEKTWKAIIPSLAFNYNFIEDTIANQYGKEQKMQGIFYAFAGLSLLIACLGLFGLSIFVVQRKVKEIGIRKVLGASVSSVVSLVSKDFLKLVMISALIACPLAWYFMNGWLADFAYRINISVWIFVIAGIVALAIALCTVAYQALKAATANPVTSLRSE